MVLLNIASNIYYNIDILGYSIFFLVLCLKFGLVKNVLERKYDKLISKQKD
jgi:hypothetical protein